MALLARGERHHLAAKAFLRQASREKLPLVTSDFVLDETYTLLKVRYGASAAVRFGDDLRRSAWLRVHPIVPALQERAWHVFKRTRDQDFSFTDCTSFTLMAELRLQAAFTFDSGFERYGLEKLPSVR